MVKPFLKWTGGKTKLLPQLVPLLPSDWRNRQYVEPFVGGGALFFHLEPENALLNDSNRELINTYRIIAANVAILIGWLEDAKRYHNKTNYYNLRDMYNNPFTYNLTQTEKAAIFIYLNKTCFNGLYRVNKKDEFNVPIGSYKKPNICDEKVLLEAFRILKNATLYSLDFEELIDFINPDAFVYFDPPYVPITKTSNFTSYTKSGFTEKDQIRLRGFFEKLTRLGCKCMLSNSDCDTVRELYKNFNIKEVETGRSINCKGTKRGKIKELVILNY